MSYTQKKDPINDLLTQKGSDVSAADIHEAIVASQAASHIDFTRLDGMTGELTGDDIAEGLQGDCEHCPVALAVGRMFEGFQVYVESAVIIHNGGDVRLSLYLGETLGDWIEAFDLEDDAVKPIGLRISTWNLKGYEYRIDAVEVAA